MWYMQIFHPPIHSFTLNITILEQILEKFQPTIHSLLIVPYIINIIILDM